MRPEKSRIDEERERERMTHKMQLNSVVDQLKYSLIRANRVMVVYV